MTPAQPDGPLGSAVSGSSRNHPPHSIIAEGLTIPPTNNLNNRINEQIRISPVRVIGVEGEQLGVMPVRDALTKAKDAGMDLVEVAAEARPPVCRIMDYGKFRYEKTKRSGKNKAHQTKLKEIRLRPRTGDHDIEFKVKQAISFLQDKDKVQVTVVYKGRELAHIDEGERVIQSVIEKLVEFGKLESPPNRQARKVMCTIAPK